jgi:hypothetical protein
MIDPQDPDLSRFVVDLVDHSIRASPSGPEPFQLAAQRVANALWIVGERSQHELHDGRRRFLGQSGKTTLGRRGDDQLPTGAGHALLG